MTHYEEHLNPVVLSLGANCGDRHSSIAKAAESLCLILHGAECSPIYETPDMSRRPEMQPPKYMNMVVRGFTDKKADELNSILKLMELQAGRDSLARKEHRVPLDIDIVCFCDEILRPADFSHPFFRIGFNYLLQAASPQQAPKE